MGKKITLTLCALFCGIILAACSSIVSVEINNTENSNLNNRLDDVPLTIIVYQLKHTKKFEDANDIDLLSKEDSILGKDKIDSIKMQVAPKSDTIALEFNAKDVPYIGILALFANKTNKVNKIWVATKDAKGFGKHKILQFKITNNGIKNLEI